MTIFVNGEKKEIRGEINLAGLLRHFSLPLRRIAIELNQQVVRRKDWERIEVNDEDRIEIVHFVGGG